MNIVSGIKNRKQYSNYKDSGVEWLGQVPEHWSLWKLSHAFRLIGSGTTPQTDNLDFYNGDISWVTTSELRENLIIDTNSKLTSKALKQYPMLFLYPPGTLLIAMYGATIGRLGILGILACTNQACCAFSHPVALDIKYAFYWLLMRRREIVLMSSGGGQPNVNQEKLRSLKIPAPGLDEQRTIATFLDRETAKIDALIAKKERLIELLQEKRAALISHAVTKGLDPSAPMKDSGVEWLGEIPEHWEVKQLKRLASLRAGYAITSEIIEEVGEYPVFGGNGIRGYTSSYTHEGEFPLIGRQGALCGCVNFAHGRFWASEHAVVVTPKPEVNAYWLTHLLGAMSLNAYSESAAQPGLGVETISSLRMPMPFIAEQHAIAAFLDRETTEIDTLRSKI